MAAGKKLTKKEFGQLEKKLKKKLSIKRSPFSSDLLKKRQQNLRISKKYHIRKTLTKTDDVESIVKIRKENPDNWKKWKVRKNWVYTSEKDFEIAALRPGKEAHEKYKANSYYGKNGKSTAAEKKVRKCNKYDFLPVILDKNKNIARRVEYQTHQAWRNALKKDELVNHCKKEGINPYVGKKKLIEKIIGRAKTKDALLDLSGKRNPKLYTPPELKKLANEHLGKMSESYIQKMADKHLGPRRHKTCPNLKKKLDDKKSENPEPKIIRYTPWTLEHLALGLEKLKDTDKGKVALEIIGSLLVRMAYMLDHEQNKRSGLYELQIPPEALKALKQILPNGIIVVHNKVKEDDESKDEDEEDYIDVDALLYFLDLLSNNEDIKSDWKGHKELQNQDDMKHTPIGRVNTLLTYATFIALFIKPSKNMFSKTLFQYNRTQNDPRTLEFYQENFRFLKP